MLYYFLEDSFCFFLFLSLLFLLALAKSANRFGAGADGAGAGADGAGADAAGSNLELLGNLLVLFCFCVCFFCFSTLLRYALLDARAALFCSFLERVFSILFLFFC